MRALKRLALFAVVSLSFSSFGQNYLGVHSSNFGGVMATDLQPASFVDGRFKFDLNLASFNFGLWNNAAYFDSGDMPKWWFHLMSYCSSNDSSYQVAFPSWIDYDVHILYQLV